MATILGQGTCISILEDVVPGKSVCGKPCVPGLFYCNTCIENLNALQHATPLLPVVPDLESYIVSEDTYRSSRGPHMWETIHNMTNETPPMSMVDANESDNYSDIPPFYGFCAHVLKHGHRKGQRCNRRITIPDQMFCIICEKRSTVYGYCSYILTRGSRKGERCEAPITTQGNVFCHICEKKPGVHGLDT